jgi:Ni2+-binding GTPase involved in maturation of urease and hydrogenase
MVVVAGTPGSGKTSVLMHAVKDLLRAGHTPAVVKIDCMWTEDDARFKRQQVPVAVGLAKDMCPDHYAIYNFDEMLAWAAAQGADIILN